LIASADVRGPSLSIVCEPCGRRGRYSVAKLMQQYGDAKLTDLLVTLNFKTSGRRGARIDA
jgi:hypothetical protein